LPPCRRYGRYTELLIRHHDHLGRGGSDYTAAIAGADVRRGNSDLDGCRRHDDRGSAIVPDARKVKQISFAEASELAYSAPKSFHPMTVLPAVDRDIPVFILNSRKPAGSGLASHRDSPVQD